MTRRTEDLNPPADPQDGEIWKSPGMRVEHVYRDGHWIPVQEKSDIAPLPVTRSPENAAALSPGAPFPVDSDRPDPAGPAADPDEAPRDAFDPDPTPPGADASAFEGAGGEQQADSVIDVVTRTGSDDAAAQSGSEQAGVAAKNERDTEEEMKKQREREISAADVAKLKEKRDEEDAQYYGKHHDKKHGKKKD